MGKGTWFDISGGIDMQIFSPAGDTALYILAVVPEIHGKQRLCLAEVTNLPVHEFSLLGSHHQVGNRIRTHRHIGKEPCEFYPFVNQEVEKLFAADYFGVIARIAKGSAKGQLFLFENLHGADDRLISTLAAAGIGCLFKAFDTDGGYKILHAQHFVGKFLVNQRAVCKCKKLTITVLFAKADNIFFADKRLPTGINEKIYAQILALFYDAVQRLVAHGRLTAIFSRPAAGTLKITGGGGVHQNRPRNVACILFLIFPLYGKSDKVFI
ncbi:hypothetical protein SDC9_125868 [bioreactor metagenome]|uniref:Uncharacterized protein n=1 Tax=bioreactor metagenome TaxID=1076179 RepID=A0A645CPJ7_9ZZZZ